MRSGEAMALTRADVDLVEGVITVRHAKFDRMRLVPLHPSVTTELRAYATTRDRLCRTPSVDRFFVSVTGRALHRRETDAVFRDITASIGLRTDTVHPRIHDLRHAFAVHTLIDGHRNGADISALLPVLSTYLGHVEPANTYWYLSAVPELMQLAAARLEQRGRPAMTALAPVLQAFFTDRLIAQRRASPHTIAGYRDTFRLLVGFATTKTHKRPSALDIADLDAPLITAFLDHLEVDRRNTVRTRNWRLAAIHSLFGYAALQPPRTRRHHPAGPCHPHQTPRPASCHLAHRRRGRRPAGRTRPRAPGPAGAITPCSSSPSRPGYGSPSSSACPAATSRSNVALTSAAWARAARNEPHRSPGSPIAVLRDWLAERGGQPGDPLFPTRTGTRLSHDAIEHRLAGHLDIARISCRSLRGKHVTMHTLRHTAAMRLLHAGTDIAVIALWLGHEQLATAHIYLHADMNQKERAIDRVTPPGTAAGRYQPPDPLLAFLDSL